MIAGVFHALIWGGIVAGWSCVFVVVLYLLNEFYRDRMSRDD